MFQNCVAIDLTKFNYERLPEALEAATSVGVSEELSIEILKASKKCGFVKVFIDKRTGLIVAYTTKKNRKHVEITEDFGDELLKLPNLSTDSIEAVSQEKCDKLLDKIGKKGIDSLTKLEKKYLDKFAENSK
jgi:hypothetical protein